MEMSEPVNEMCPKDFWVFMENVDGVSIDVLTVSFNSEVSLEPENSLFVYITPLCIRKLHKVCNTIHVVFKVESTWKTATPGLKAS